MASVPKKLFALNIIVYSETVSKVFLGILKETLPDSFATSRILFILSLLS